MSYLLLFKSLHLSLLTPLLQPVHLTIRLLQPLLHGLSTPILHAIAWGQVSQFITPALCACNS